MGRKSREKKRRIRLDVDPSALGPGARGQREVETRPEKPGERPFRREAAILRRGVEPAKGVSDAADRLAQGWAPLFERYRGERIADILREPARLRAGTSQTTAFLPSLGQIEASASVHASLQLLRAALDRTALYLFTPSAFAMCAYLLARDTRIGVDLLPQAPLWIEYARPLRMRADLPELATSAFWFGNPYQAETLAEAMRRGYLPPDLRQLAHAFTTERERGSWMLEVYLPGRNPVAVLAYHVPSQSWDFAPGHVHVCPHQQCALEPLEGGGGFIVACQGCRGALSLYTRVLVTSLLVTAGAFRAALPEEDAPSAVGTPSPGRAQAADQRGERPTPGSSRAGAGREQHGVGAPPSPPTAGGGAGASPQAPRPPHGAGHGYTIVEFDASVRPRPRTGPRTRRQHWSHGRQTIDLAALNDLDIAVDDQAVVLVDLSFSGITRTLRSSYFRHKQGQIIAVRDYTVPRVRMTYAAYKRRLQNRRITKVTALRFRGAAASEEPEQGAS